MSFKTDALNDTLNYGLTASKVYDFATSDDIADSPAGWEACYDKEHARLIVSGDAPQVFTLKDAPQGEYYYLKIDSSSLSDGESSIQASINIGSEEFNLINGGIVTITTHGVGILQVVVKNCVVNNIHIGVAHSDELPEHSAIKDMYTESIHSYVPGDKLDVTTLRGFGYYDSTGLIILNFPLSKSISSSVIELGQTSNILHSLVVIGIAGAITSASFVLDSQRFIPSGFQLTLHVTTSSSSSKLPSNTSPVVAYVGGSTGNYIYFNGPV